MKILIVGDINSLYILEYGKHIKASWNGSLDLDILTWIPPQEPFRDTEALGVFRNIYSIKPSDSSRSRLPVLRFFDWQKVVGQELARCEESYDYCHIHYLDTRVVWLLPRISKMARWIVASVWGSDYYRASAWQKMKLSPVIREARRISFGNPATLKAFRRTYWWVNPLKLSICRFGLSTLDTLRDIAHLSREDAKQTMGFRSDDIVVTLGVNASKAQRHLSLLASLKTVRKQLPRNTLAVLLATYGLTDFRYRDQVTSAAVDSGLAFRMFENYRSPLEIALLRKASDIMVNVQTTDQLSGTMLEYLYTNTVVINGAWLPYQILDEKGAFTLKVDKVAQVGRVLLDCVNNLDTYRSLTQRNPGIVWSLMSWENTIPDWLNLYTPGEEGTCQ